MNGLAGDVRPKSAHAQSTRRQGWQPLASFVSRGLLPVECSERDGEMCLRRRVLKPRAQTSTGLVTELRKTEHWLITPCGEVITLVLWHELSDLTWTTSSVVQLETGKTPKHLSDSSATVSNKEFSGGRSSRSYHGRNSGAISKAEGPHWQATAAVRKLKEV